MPVLLGLLLVPSIWFVFTIAGPDAWSIQGLRDAPFSPAGETLLASLLLPATLVLAGVWPFGAIAGGPRFAPLGAILLIAVVVPMVGDGWSIGAPSMPVGWCSLPGGSDEGELAGDHGWSGPFCDWLWKRVGLLGGSLTHRRRLPAGTEHTDAGNGGAAGLPRRRSVWHCSAPGDAGERGGVLGPDAACGRGWRAADAGPCSPNRLVAGEDRRRALRIEREYLVVLGRAALHSR